MKWWMTFVIIFVASSAKADNMVCVDPPAKWEKISFARTHLLHKEYYRIDFADNTQGFIGRLDTHGDLLIFASAANVIPRQVLGHVQLLRDSRYPQVKIFDCQDELQVVAKYFPQRREILVESATGAHSFRAPYSGDEEYRLRAGGESATIQVLHDQGLLWDEWILDVKQSPEESLNPMVVFAIPFLYELIP